MPFFYLGSILGGLLIGTLAGRWLGGLVADLRYRPTPGGAPAPQIHKGWVGAGASWAASSEPAVGIGTHDGRRSAQVQARWLMLRSSSFHRRFCAWFWAARRGDLRARRADGRTGQCMTGLRVVVCRPCVARTAKLRRVKGSRLEPSATLRQNGRNEDYE